MALSSRTSMSDFARMSFEEMKSQLDVSATYFHSPSTFSVRQRPNGSARQLFFTGANRLALSDLTPRQQNLLIDGPLTMRRGRPLSQRIPLRQPLSRRVTTPFVPAFEQTLPYNPEDYMLPPGVGMDEDMLTRNYTRQQSARRGTDVFRTPRGGEDYDELLALDESVTKKKVSERRKRQLETRLPSSKEQKSECNICKEKVRKSCRVTKLPCSHLFHESCVMKWFDYNTTCPTCRQEV